MNQVELNPRSKGKITSRQLSLNTPVHFNKQHLVKVARLSL